jgi:hypothetical protein
MKRVRVSVMILQLLLIKYLLKVSFMESLSPLSLQWRVVLGIHGTYISALGSKQYLCLLLCCELLYC